IGCLANLSFKCCHGGCVDDNTALTIFIDRFLFGDNFRSQSQHVECPHQVHIDNVCELFKVMSATSREDPSWRCDTRTVNYYSKPGQSRLLLSIPHPRWNLLC